MVQIKKEFELHDAQKEQPKTQDQMCVLIIEEEVGNEIHSYPLNHLYLWNGSYWWRCDGVYYEELDGEEIDQSVFNEDIKYFIPMLKGM